MRQPIVLHFLGYDDDRGGVLTAIRLIAAQGGAHVLVVNPAFHQRRTPWVPERRGPPVPVETIALRSLWPTLRAAFALLPTLRTRHIVLHAHSRSGLLVALWLWLIGENSVLVSPHCYAKHRWLYRWAATLFADRWTWLSPTMKQYYAAGSANWRNCLPEPVAPLSGARIRLKIVQPNPGTVVIGGIGTLVEWKGWHLVLEALAQLSAEEQSRLRFMQIGDTDGSAASEAYGKFLRQRTKEKGLESVVTWCGWQADSREFLARIDMLVVPSRDEPMALAGLEALAAGVPLLIADSGGLNDIVTPGCDALIFRTGDAGDLARRLREVAGGKFLSSARIDSVALERMDVRRVAAEWRLRYAAAIADPDHVI